MRQLAGRVAVVTGAASGIGRATAGLLGRRGCDLALVDVDAEALARTAGDLAAEERCVSTHPVDVNVSSLFAFVGFAGQGSYCATKAAVRALSEALWVELRGTNVGVTCVHPGATSTAIVRRSRTSNPEARDRAADRFDRLQRDPARVARAIVRGIERDRPRVLVHPETRLAEWTKRLAPVTTQRLVAWLYRRLGPIG